MAGRQPSDWAQDRGRYPAASWLLQPAWWAIAVYRFNRWTLTAPLLVRPVVHALGFVAYSVVRLVTGIDIPRQARIGPGLMIHHFGAIIIHPQAVIGRDATLRHGVTVGAQRDGGGVPTLGDNVTLGAFAQVLGDITVGDGATVGALSLVIRDVPAGAVVAGVPAKPLPR